MVNNFSILLLLLHTVRQRIIANQFVNNGFKNHIETLHQEILLFLRVDKHLSCFIKKGIAQIPKFQCLVREILVFDLAKTGTSIAFEIGFKLCSLNQGELAFDVLRKTVCIANVIQDWEENYQKFLVEVNLPFLVDWVQIDGLLVLHDGCLMADGARPVYLVEARVHILHDEEEKTLIILIKLQQLQQDVQIGIAQSAATLAYLCNLRMINNIRIVPLVILINHNGPINPYGKLIDKVALCLSQGIVLIKLSNVLGPILAKSQFQSVHIFEKYLWKNKHTVTQ